MASTVNADMITSGDIDPKTAPSTWPKATNAYIGYSGTGTMSITDGSSVTHTQGNAYIGYETGSSGTVTVDGDGTAWDNYYLYVARSGTGTLTITNGGSVEDYWGIIADGSSDGTVTVDGEGSTWTNTGSLYVGKSGTATGTLTVTNGGAVLSNSYAYLGYGPGAKGMVTVDGKGSTWTNESNLTLGYNGTGTLAITNGGSATAGLTTLGDYGFDSIGTVTVDGEGSTWSCGSLTVGAVGTGTTTITNGGSVSIGSSTWLGCGYSLSGTVYNSNGTVTVDGEGSAWETNSLIVGYLGSGTLNIFNRSTVSVTETTEIGELGNIAFGDHGGSLTTGSLYVGRSQLSGTGTVNTSGVVIDSDITFDDSHGNEQSFLYDGVTINLSQDASSDLGVGWRGEGTLTIKDGVTVASGNGYLGYHQGSDGVATVDGTGSSWKSDFISVGNSGMGTLSITNGGTVTVDLAYIAHLSGSSGTVTVDGNGSTLIGGGLLGHSGTVKVAVTSGGTARVERVYLSGSSTLSVTSGGTVRAESVELRKGSIVTVDVGSGSVFKVGTADNKWTGGIDNDGTIRLLAGAGTEAGTYRILYGDIYGNGTVQVLGGKRISSSNQVLKIAVYDAVTAHGSGGASATLDLTVSRRALITDSNTGESAGAGFMGSTSPITLTATAVGGDDRDSLQGLLAGTDEEILSAWDFSTEGYTVSEDNPVCLSLYAYSADDLSSLTIWHLESGDWIEYDAPDLTFDGTYASFVVSGLGGYAVAASEVTGGPTTGGSKAMPWIPFLLLSD